ncbi:hypothetical protein [Nocardia sp. CC227C]|uniref:hypothetical protein n=1 Tax=Nocardia sp. CC227C TaxID=3044562 RepID=UPI00278C4A84|nr:hypothetical protein [Nocardia sp. CC227C]
MTLEEVAGELYGVAPAGFIAARDEWVRRAREGGDRELAAAIGKLRRPTVAAWAVNVLAREAADEVAALLAVGDSLREAQRKLSGDALRSLTTERQRVVNALTKKSGELAAAHDQKLSEATLREIGQTLHAALADPDVAEAVRTGTLATAASYAGFGPATLAAVPTPESPSATATVPGTGTGTGTGTDSTRTHADDGAAHPMTGGAAQRDRAGTAGELASTAADALAALESARAARDTAQAERDRVAADLTAVEDRIAALRADLSHAESERRVTVAANRTAQEALNKAQRHLDHVERWAEKARARLSSH